MGRIFFIGMQASVFTCGLLTGSLTESKEAVSMPAIIALGALFAGVALCCIIFWKLRQ